jgi:hypothetical protein
MNDELPPGLRDVEIPETDYGTWICDHCGAEEPGERGEPPLDHLHRCDGATSGDLTFEEAADE